MSRWMGRVVVGATLNAQTPMNYKYSASATGGGMLNRFIVENPMF